MNTFKNLRLYFLGSVVADHLHFEIELQKLEDEFKALYKGLKGISGDAARSGANAPAPPPPQVDPKSISDESGGESRPSGYGNLQLVGKVLHLTETSEYVV